MALLLVFPNVPFAYKQAGSRAAKTALGKERQIPVPCWGTTQLYVEGLARNGELARSESAQNGALQGGGWVRVPAKPEFGRKTDRPH